MAAAIACLISVVFGSGPDGSDFALVGGTVAAVGAHLLLHPDRGERILLLLVPTAALTWAAMFGDFFLILVEGGCDDSGDIGLVSWIGAGAIYLAGSAWALQRPLRGLIGVPASMLAAGVWLVLSADAISGGTGVCLD